MVSVVENDLLKTTDVARLLGISGSTLRAWRSRGVGPRFYQIHGRNGMVKYHLRDVETWLDRQVVHPTMTVRAEPRKGHGGMA